MAATDELILDDDGHVEVDLPTNDVEVTSPADSFYRVTVLDSSPTISRAISLTDDLPSEVSWTDEAIQLDDPEMPSVEVSSDRVRVGEQSLTNYLEALEVGGSPSSDAVTVPAAPRLPPPLPTTRSRTTMNEATRAYIYRILVAVSLVVVARGLVSESEVTLWLGVAAAVLGNGLAAANTTTKG